MQSSRSEPRPRRACVPRRGPVAEYESSGHPRLRRRSDRRARARSFSAAPPRSGWSPTRRTFAPRHSRHGPRTGSHRRSRARAVARRDSRTRRGSGRPRRARSAAAPTRSTVQDPRASAASSPGSTTQPITFTSRPDSTSDPWGSCSVTMTPSIRSAASRSISTRETSSWYAIPRASSTPRSTELRANDTEPGPSGIPGRVVEKRFPASWAVHPVAIQTRPPTITASSTRRRIPASTGPTP